MVLAENGDMDTVEKMCRNLSRIMRYITNTAEKRVVIKMRINLTLQSHAACFHFLLLGFVKLSHGIF